MKCWLASKFQRDEEGQPYRSNARSRAFGHTDRIPELLIPPGTLIHIDSRPNVAPQLYWAMPNLYNEMSISFHMFSDHLPILYVENLLHVIREHVQLKNAT